MTQVFTTCDGDLVFSSLQRAEEELFGKIRTLASRCMHKCGFWFEIKQIQVDLNDPMIHIYRGDYSLTGNRIDIEIRYTNPFTKEEISWTERLRKNSTPGPQ